MGSSLQQLKKGVVTLTVRTRLRSPSLTPCATPTLLSRSSSPSSSASGGTPVPGPDEADGSFSSRKGPGPKDRIVMDVTLNKGKGVLEWAGRMNVYFLGEVFGKTLINVCNIQGTFPCCSALESHSEGEEHSLMPKLLNSSPLYIPLFQSGCCYW